MTDSGFRRGLFPFAITALLSYAAIGPVLSQTQPPTTEPAEKEKKPFDAKAADKEIKEIVNKIPRLQKDLKEKVTPSKPILLPPPQTPVMPPEPFKPPGNADKKTLDQYNKDYQQWQQQMKQFKLDQAQYPERKKTYDGLTKLFPAALTKWEEKERQRINGINEEIESLKKRRKELEDQKKEAKKPDNVSTNK